MLKEAKISEDDLDIFTLVDTVEEAVGYLADLSARVLKEKAPRPNPLLFEKKIQK